MGSAICSCALRVLSEVDVIGGLPTGPVSSPRGAPQNSPCEFWGPQKRGPMLRALSIAYGAWVPALASLGRDDGIPSILILRYRDDERRASNVYLVPTADWLTALPNASASACKARQPVQWPVMMCGMRNGRSPSTVSGMICSMTPPRCSPPMMQ